MKQDRKQAVYTFLSAAAVFLIGGLIQPRFLSLPSVKAILMVASFVGIVAAGQTFVVLVGGIDLSVPWVLNGAAVLLMELTVSTHGNLGLSVPVILLVLLAAAAVGAVNGLGVAYLNISPVVMTLAVNGVVEGVVLGQTHGFSCRACSEAAPSWLVNLVYKGFWGIPGQLAIWLGLAILITLVLSWTSFGRRVYALGLNPVASYLCGVRNKPLTVALYGLSGLFAGLAGILLLGYTGVPAIGIGDPYLFASIAAVVVGGVAITGGRGHYLGAAAGAIVLTTVVTLLIAKNMPSYLQSVLYGLAVLTMSLVYNRGRDTE